MSWAARSHRSAAQGASRSPYRAVLASDATPRCASMASADRQMIGDATLAKARLAYRHHVLVKDAGASMCVCRMHCWRHSGDRHQIPAPGFGPRSPGDAAHCPQAWMLRNRAMCAHAVVQRKDPAMEFEDIACPQAASVANATPGRARAQPLSGIRVLDFSSLVPGPLCTLLLAEAGAEVTKIERPQAGDEMRGYAPKAGEDSANFVLLNRGKKSIAIDLKTRAQELHALIGESDLLIEQFRPGVMARLGLDYESVRAINPRIIYCAITGYGQSGPQALEAAHDLNYLASTGLLGLCRQPALPPALIADIAGGAYPAVINILLALRQRDQTGQGCMLDVSMADNLFTFQYWGLGAGWAAQQWPQPGADLISGGTPRYQVYRAADGQYLAVAPLEEKFWRNFTRRLELPETASAEQVAQAIARHDAAHWQARFAGIDVCVNRVVALEQAVNDPHFVQRGLFAHQVCGADGVPMPALPVPLSGQFRAAPGLAHAPKLASTV